MKTELWPKIRPGTWVIYADDDAGVQRAKISDVDIRVEDSSYPGGYYYPYGKTAATGAVKIKYGEVEILENLENLITYGPEKLGKLRRAWLTWQAVKSQAAAAKENFTELAQEYRSL